MKNAPDLSGQSIDMAQYLGLFLDEADEQLDVIEANVLALENSSADTETLNALFRAAHTIKGSSRAMGLMAIGRLTHAMEDALDLLRLGTLSPSREVTDTLLSCLDTLRQRVAAVQSNGNDEPSEAALPEFDALIGRVNSLHAENVEIGGPTASSSEPANLATASYRLDIVIDPECVMKSIRVFMIFAAIESIAGVVKCTPPQAELERDSFDGKFSLEVTSSERTTLIESTIRAITEVASVTVKPVDDSDGATHQATAPASKSGADAPHVLPTAAQTVRVDVTRLDKLLNLVGEMVIGRTQVTELSSRLLSKLPGDSDLRNLIEASHQMALITGELQSEIMKTRMLPIDVVFQRYPRMVRDLAQKLGKDVRFEVSGGETELDRSVLEFIGDPILHMLRNSIDHGIEGSEQRAAAGKPTRGHVQLKAGYAESNIVVEIIDDGAGIDPDRVRAKAVEKGIVTIAQAQRMTDRDAMGLIFAPGFSTAESVSDISGRGVGMDIAKSNIEKLGGQIIVDSVLGLGCHFTIRLPLTLAIVRALLVEAGGARYVVPLSSVIETLRLSRGDGADPARTTVLNSSIMVLRGRSIPLASLAGVLSGDESATAPENIPMGSYVVVVGFGDRQVGLVVDGLRGQQETVIKSLGQFLGNIPTISGATILGDGSVALIVDVPKAVDMVTG
jgi:two-component system chemotaxis sensor kinase CheA